MKANTMGRRTQVTALLCLVINLFLTISANAQRTEKGVRVVKNEASRRVDVFVDGQPFTSYVWPEKLKVPVLYPLRTATGTIVTRGFPLEPRAGERVDHPHHAGLWLNYGKVNGVDFIGRRRKPREVERDTANLRDLVGGRRRLQPGRDWASKSNAPRAAS